jgi:thiol-disulfide isomerase/thioredoxin
MRLAGLIALASLLAPPAFAQRVAPDSSGAVSATRITGTILDAGGRPMALANVTLAGTGRPITVIQAERDGRFALETDSIGALTLMFTGVDHESKTASVLVPDRGGEIAIDVRLRTYRYDNDLSNVAVIGDFNGMSLSRGARKMEPQDDGTFVLEVPVAPGTDSLAYQLMNTVGTGHSVNGTQSDWFVYDNAGDYRSVIRVKGGVARIRFDPGKLRRADEAASVVFRDRESLAARYARFLLSLEEARAPYVAEQGRMREAKVSQDSIRTWANAYDWSGLDAFLDSALAATEDSDVRATLLAAYVGYAPHTDSLTARMLLAELPPESWKWTIGYGTLSRAIYASGRPDDYANFVMAVLRKNPNTELRAGAVQYLLHRAQRAKAEGEIGLLYAWLVSEYPESFEAQYARTQLDPDRAIQLGQPAPAFSVVALEDSTVTYSNDSMRGRVYLLEFWAVWCGPCIAELPSLETAFQKYRDDGFTILSLSFDGRPEDVTTFRADGEYKMPWLHAFIAGGFQSALATTFQVLGIPKAVLIGRDGSVVATEGELRGQALDTTLARVLGPETSTGQRNDER